MAIDIRYKRQLWKFLVVGFCLTAVSFFTRSEPDIPLPNAVGEIFSGAFYAWIIWLFWAKAYKLGAGIVIFLGIIVGLSLHNDRSTPFDFPVAIAACSASCQPQWNHESGNPASPAYKMTEADTKDLCDCSCETGLKSLRPELLIEFRDVKTREELRTNAEFLSSMQKALPLCYTKHVRKQ